MQKHKSVKRALVAALAIGLIVMWAFSLFPKRARWWNCNTAYRSATAS